MTLWGDGADWTELGAGFGRRRSEKRRAGVVVNLGESSATATCRWEDGEVASRLTMILVGCETNILR